MSGPAPTRRILLLPLFFGFGLVVFYRDYASLLHSKVCSIKTQPTMHDVAEWLFSWFIMRLYRFDIKFRVQHCQKYTSHKKKVQIKVVQNWISYKKVCKRICLSFPGVELGGSKIGMFEVLLCRKMQITFNLGLNAVKNTHPMKKASNKSCSELNFGQKSLWAHMSISPQSGTRGLKRLIWWNIILCWNGKLYLIKKNIK